MEQNKKKQSFKSLTTRRKRLFEMKERAELHVWVIKKKIDAVDEKIKNL